MANINYYANHNITGTLSTSGVITSGGVITAPGGNSTQWNTSYDNMITGLAVTGTTTKTLTATQQDGGTLTASWADDSGSNNYLNAVSWNSGTGVITFGRLGLNSLTLDIDGRYVTSSGVTSVATGNGISGGTITSTGTLTVGAGDGLSQSSTGLLMSGSYSNNFTAGTTATAANRTIRVLAADSYTAGFTIGFYRKTASVNTAVFSFPHNSSTVTFNSDITVSGGDITLGGTGRIQGVDTVSANTDAANKLYVDNAIAGVPQDQVVL
jgi:hypothetical protein